MMVVGSECMLLRDPYPLLPRVVFSCPYPQGLRMDVRSCRPHSFDYRDLKPG